MRTAIRYAAILVFTATLSGAQPLTREAFAEERQRTRAALPDASAVPAQWELETEGRRYSIPTAPLKDALKKSPPDVEAARLWLDQLELHTSASASSGTSADDGQERQRLSAILARGEFRGAKPPSYWEELRAHISVWILQMFARLFTLLPTTIGGAEFWFWILLSLAVGLLGMFLLRYWMRRGRPAAWAAPAVQTHEGRTWQEWLRAAQEAASQNAAAEAIRCGYWAGVSHLQTERLLPPKLSQTPRELVAHARQSRAPQATVDSLSTLTANFERFWYGRGQPGADDVRTSFQHLEALGCRLD